VVGSPAAGLCPGRLGQGIGLAWSAAAPGENTAGQPARGGVEAAECRRGGQGAAVG
jgi:hypothetical protein